MFEKWASKLQERSKQQTPEDIQFKNFDDTAAAPVAEPIAQPVDPEPPVSSIQAGAANDNIELKVVRPESFADVSMIADHLLANCTVVLNVELLDKTSAGRMLDFLNGVTYSTNGEIKQVAQGTYILTPNNVDVTEEEK